jgi:hypothetical protein
MGKEREGFANGYPLRVPNTVTLPGHLGFFPCLRNVRQQQACAQAALIFQAACDSASAHSVRRGACDSGLDPRACLHTARQAAPGLQKRDELALGLGIPLDIALRHGEAGMARELLHVPETTPDLRHAARRAGNEGAAPRMGRTAIHLQ